MIIKTKDPDSRLDYPVSWLNWLNGDSISMATWITTSGITVGTGAYAPSFTGTVATIWLEGGTLGTVYDITCRVTTALGRIDDFTFQVSVQAT
jgi:hypothetical protein